MTKPPGGWGGIGAAVAAALAVLALVGKALGLWG